VVKAEAEVLRLGGDRTSWESIEQRYCATLIDGKQRGMEGLMKLLMNKELMEGKTRSWCCCFNDVFGRRNRGRDRALYTLPTHSLKQGCTGIDR
jgi:hypothetical protein